MTAPLHAADADQPPYEPAVPNTSPHPAHHQALLNGIARWRSAARASRPHPSSTREADRATPGVLAKLPRRKFLNAAIGETAPPPQMKAVGFRLSYSRAFGRLLISTSVLLGAAAAVCWDQVRGKNTVDRRAMHLRRALERMGATCVTIGRHFGMRLELLQSKYGDELSRMRDYASPFPVDQAITIIERTTKKPLQETFAQFDPEPVVSTSMACTYQAVLHTGEKIVAKVRRPGIGEQFVEYLKVFDWIAALTEIFTILKPGQTRQIRHELRDALLEELDFVREARHQDMFRRAARKSGKHFFTTPRVHFELSGDEVIVQEFASGMWLWELLAGVEQGNKEVLALAASLNIDVRKVARRLVWVGFWSWQENLFFLAEPHPHNIILGENGTLTFIDFTSTGAMDRSKRQALQQNLYYASKRDPQNMARASLVLLEPLPPVDVIALTKELESFNWHMLYAFEADDVPRPWFERTTARQWTGLAQVAREYGVVIDFRVLRLLRATIMYETLAARLDDTLSVTREHRRFMRNRARRASQRAIRAIARRIGAPADKMRYLQLEQVAGIAEGLFFRLRHGLALPHINFNAMIGKGSYTFVRFMKFTTQVIAVTAIGVALVMVGRALRGYDVVSYQAAIGWVFSSKLFHAIVALLLFVNSRAVLFRLDDKDV